MNDKDRELLIQALHQGGRIGEAAFTSLARWQFMDGLTTVICILAGLIFLAFLFSRLLRWEVHDEAAIAKGAGLLLIAGVATILVTTALPAGFREMLSPDGAAVAYFLAHH